jgi:hypothetical protein
MAPREVPLYVKATLKSDKAVKNDRRRCLPRKSTLQSFTSGLFASGSFEQMGHVEGLIFDDKRVDQV